LPAFSVGSAVFESFWVLALAAKIGRFLKIGVIAVLLLGAGGAVYYYAVFLPRRDAVRADEERLEQARDAAAKHAEQERLLAQQQELEQRRAQQQAAAQVRYQACLTDAAAAHTASWATQCKSIADKTAADRDNCLSALKLPKAYCDSSYTVRDGSPTCTLPTATASVIDADLERARNRCLQESKAAVQ
jgi:hypothetical protein